MKTFTPPERKDFGNWLRSRRKKAGLTTKQVAHHWGVCEARVKQIECGYDPVPLFRLFDIPDLYELDLEEILERLRSAEPDLYARYRLLERKFLELFVKRFTQHYASNPNL